MKNYLIVGGSSGIGRALVEILEETGNNVYATYCKNPVSSQARVSYHYLDVKDETYDLSFLPSIIDGLVFCPGSIQLKPFHRIKVKDFVGDYQFQVVAACKLIQQTLPLLKLSEQASIVLLSTVAVQMGFPFHAQISASKGAIEGLTRSLAAEFAPQIRVNAIAPSLTNTKLAERLLNTETKKEIQVQNNPMKKIGEAKDIAQMAAMLLSKESSWITGQIIHVDGGFSCIK